MGVVARRLPSLWGVLTVVSAGLAGAEPWPVNENPIPTVGSFTEARLGSELGLYEDPTVFQASVFGSTVVLSGVSFPDVPGSQLSPGISLGSPGTLVGILIDRGDGTFRVRFPSVSVSYLTTDGFGGTLALDLQTSGAAPGSPGAVIQGGCGGYASDTPLFGSDFDPARGELTLVGHDCYSVGAGITRAFKVVVRVTACGDQILDPGELCDDGNNRDGDCCSGRCEPEVGPGTPPCCVAGVCQTGTGCGAVCFASGTCRLGGATWNLCVCEP